MENDKEDCLSKIQSEVKVPKRQYNSFGKYNYRSCEDILEAVKPILKKHNASVTLDDDIINVGERYYVKATATLFCAGAKVYSVNGMAREPQTKKGMDESQITGAASSYARKRALDGLFAIDDTDDIDAIANETPVEIDYKSINNAILVDDSKLKDDQIELKNEVLSKLNQQALMRVYNKTVKHKKQPCNWYELSNERYDNFIKWVIEDVSNT